MYWEKIYIRSTWFEYVSLNVFNDKLVCWAASHRRTRPVLAQLQDQRKILESATETLVV